jgi:D-glycero-alpha-D-manno-heptose-7-phosphate kinase
MNKVTVRAPVRADLAGGTLDLWPLYLFHPGSRTVNVAISYYAESEVVETGDSAIEIHLTDQQYEQRYETLQELAADQKAALIHRVLEHFHLTGIRITTRTDAPRGSGLGGSSALTVTLVRALCELTGNPIEGDDLVNLVRDLETRLIGVPAGIQDYYPAVYGGLAALHLNPGNVVRHEIPLPVERLAEHMLLHYTGVAHFSGTNNWEMYKRQIDGKRKVHKGFDRIAQSAMEMEKALIAGDFRAAGTALGHEWENRKALIAGISTPEIEAAITAATGAGAWAGKVCGAGGGGCIVFLLPPEAKESVRRALAEVPGRVLEASPVPHGLAVERSGDGQSESFAARARHVPHAQRNDSIEHLYIYGGRGAYKPYVLAECVILQSELRSGAHETIVRSYAAPINIAGGTVSWSEAKPIDPNTLKMHAEPDPNRPISPKISLDALSQTASQSQDAFKTFVADREKLHLFHNASFALYSDAGETREAFLRRCGEEANRRLEDQTERLESTFRRRIDQVKERTERDKRDLDAKIERPSELQDDKLNVAWGQTLYNITSGKPAAVADAPQSPLENDYMAKIAQIQRAWDKELHAIREELFSKAKEIEDITITPSPKNIEVTRFLIVWATKI